MRVHAIPDTALGNFSYLIVEGNRALALDPRRDVETHLELAQQLGAQIIASVETHLHADFVSGSRELAEACGAEVIAPKESNLRTPHQDAFDGTTVTAGPFQISPLATPGHTPEHLAYRVETDDALAVFTGGCLIDGGAARTDLISPDLTDELSLAQFHSMRRLAELPDDTVLYPTHGAGSFCLAAPSGIAGVLTVGGQKLTNPLMSIDNPSDFVRTLKSGFRSYPHYFLKLREVNRGSVLVRDLESPQALDPIEVQAAIDAGAWLIDPRKVQQWAESHPAGCVCISYRDAFATWLGWVVPFGSQVVFVDRHDEALTLARRIGYDRVVGWIDGGIDAWRRSGLPVASVELLSPPPPGSLLLDVRELDEFTADHVDGSVHLELGDIIDGKTRLLDGATDVVTMCAAGERSATAASLLERKGIRVSMLAGGLNALRETV